MGRPLEFDRGEVLSSALRIFWDVGYEAASVHDLLVAMNLSKSSFYQSFENKECLFIRCVEIYGDSIACELASQLAESSSAMRFLEIAFATEQGESPSARTRGCFLTNTANAFGQSNPAVASAVTRMRKRVEDILFKAIVRAQAEGDIDNERKPRALAHFLLSSLSGLHTMARAGESPRTLRDATQAILSALR